MWPQLATGLDAAVFHLMRWLIRHRDLPFTAADPSTEILDAFANGSERPEMITTPAVPYRAAGVVAGVTQQELRFASPWQDDTVDENRQATGRLLTITDTGPWVVILPGYLTGVLTGDFGIFERLFARAALSRGLNVALLAPPYHLGRTPRDRHSGELFISSDLRRTLRAVQQAAVEAVMVAKWLRGERSQPVFVWGTSLGGWIGGLALTLAPIWSGAVLLEPLDDLASVLWRVPAAGEIRRNLGAHGVTPATVTAGFVPVQPSRRQPLLDTRRVLFVVPRHDGVVPPETQERWSQAWAGSDIVRVPHGHFTAALAAPVRRQCCDFLCHWAHAATPLHPAAMMPVGNGDAGRRR